MVACVAVTLAFKNTVKIGNAYGRSSFFSFPFFQERKFSNLSSASDVLVPFTQCRDSCGFRDDPHIGISSAHHDYDMENQDSSCYFVCSGHCISGACLPKFGSLQV